MIEIEIVPALSDNYIYIVHNQNKSLTAVIDPGEAEPVNKSLKEKNWTLNQIINTHHHYDHAAGNDTLIKSSNAKLIAPLYDKQRIKDVDQFVSDKDTIQIAGFHSEVIYTPGHTLGHVCYYLKNEKILFSGDTLFHLGCGRVFEGTMEDMKNSLKKLVNLPDDITVFCGHEYTLSNAKFCISLEPNNNELNKKYEEILNLRNDNKPTIPFNLGEEKKLNPFLKFDNQEFKNSINLNNSNEIETFKFVRNKKDNF